jgi:hypothetical protein
MLFVTRHACTLKISRYYQKAYWLHLPSSYSTTFSYNFFYQPVIQISQIGSKDDSNIDSKSTFSQCINGNTNLKFAGIA